MIGETTAAKVDPVDLEEENNPDEKVWNDFAEQVTAPQEEPEPEPEAPPEEPEPAAAEAAPPIEPEAPAEPEPEPEPESLPEAATAEPETPPEAAQPPEPEAPAEPAPQFAPAPPQAAQPLTDEQRRERVAGLRKAAISEAERSYVLSEDLENEFSSNPGKVLPKLAAQVQMTTQEVVIQEVLRMLPVAVGMEIERRKNADSFWDEFEGEWPKLKGRRPELQRMASTYQAMNPGAERAQMIRDVGASAHLAFRVPVEVAQATPVPTPEPPPPRPVTGARPAAPAPKLNVFEQYSAELEEDDD